MKNYTSQLSEREDENGTTYLRAVGVFTRIGHAHKALLGVLEFEVLVCELCPVD